MLVTVRFDRFRTGISRGLTQICADFVILMKRSATLDSFSHAELSHNNLKGLSDQPTDVVNPDCRLSFAHFANDTSKKFADVFRC